MISRRGAVRAGGLAAALTVLSGCTPADPGAPYTRDLARLVREAGPMRPSEGRISGGFAYAPFAPSARPPSPGRSREADRRALRLPTLVRRIDEALDERAGADELAAAGVARLVAGRPGGAVELLERALAAAPVDDGRYPTDLAAAYLARAVAADDPLDRLAAAETAELAVEHDPGLAEALFTRAVALESLRLVPEARSAWQRYLAVDAASEWADEARRRVERLDHDRLPVVTGQELLAAVDAAGGARLRRLVARDPAAARELGERELLTGWAEAVTAGDRATATTRLAAARALGQALVATGGDPLLADAVAAVDAAAAAPLGRRLELLVAGHRAHGEGLAAQKAYRSEEAETRFATAAEALGRAGSPFAGRSAARQAIAAYRLGRWQEALRLTGDLVPPRGAARYPSLAARAWWMRGMTLLATARPSAARDAYGAAVDAFERAGERSNVVYLWGLLAEERRFVGDLRGAWELWSRVLGELDRVRDRDRRHSLLDGAADLVAELEHDRVVLLLRSHVVRLWRRAGEPVDVAHAHLKRSRTRLRLGRRAGAEDDLAQAELLAAAVTGAVGEVLATDLAISRAMLARADDPERAVASLTRAVDHHLATCKTFFLPQLLFARAGFRRSAGDPAGAVADLRAAASGLEEQRGEIRQAAERGVFFASTAEIFDALVAALAERPSTEAEAFAAADRARARVLFDLMASAPVAGAGWEAAAPRSPFTIDELLGGLPAGHDVVAYTVLEEATLAWVVRPGGVEMLRLGIGRDEVVRLVRELDAAIASGGSRREVLAAGEPLSEHLYRPLAGRLRGAGTLVVIPDRWLAGLPFAALPGSRRDRFLIEERTLTVAPSAASLVELDRRLRRRTAVPARGTLVFGPPELGAGAIGLPALSGAIRETAAIAALDPAAVTVAGEQATQEAFVMGLARHPCIHFAGHAVSDSRQPWRSALLLAPAGEEDDGRLETGEVLELDLPHAPLVVLAACATDAAASRPRAERLTLGTAFLAAGAGGVVVTLWPVEDEATAELMTALHRGLDRGLPAPQALARAQRAAAGRLDPVQWAGFTVIGGVGGDRPAVP